MPPPIYPAALQRGSRIAISAPSSGVQAALHARLDIAIDHLRAQGFDVEEGSCLRDERQGASAPAADRAAELNRLLLRDDIDAVIPPWGGELAIELLDRLDWAALQSARPKWLLGYSDTSTLLLPITLRMGWGTAHGPCLMDLVPGQADALTSRAMAALSLTAGDRLMQQQSTHWQLHWTDFAELPGSTYQLTEATRWWPLDGAHEVHFSGRLIGGCIDTLMHTAGTPYGDVRSFIAAHAGGPGTVLYLENAEQSPSALVRALHRLRWAGWLDGIAGLLVGRSSAPESSDPLQLRYVDALRSTLSDMPCPVLLDVDIGHRPPQMVLINGAIAQVTWTAAAGGQVEQLLA